MRAQAALAAALLLAGCTALPLGGGVFTAKQAQGQADPVARQWRADASLAGLVGPEAPAGSPFLGDASADAGWPAGPHADGSVGDGRLPQWFLQYVSRAANATLGVVVHANGTVTSHEESGDHDDAALGEWSVDSPQAVEVALRDANFSAGARAGDGGVLYALGPGGADAPFWFLTAGSENAGTGGIVLVDARTGERRGFPMFGGGFPLPGGFPFAGGNGDTMGGCRPSATNAEGTLNVQRPEAEHPVEVGEGCAALGLALTWDAPVPTDRVVVEVRDPSGSVVEPEDPSEEVATGRGSYRATYRVHGGAYTAVVSFAGDTPVAVTANYQLGIQVTP